MNGLAPFPRGDARRRWSPWAVAAAATFTLLLVAGLWLFWWLCHPELLNYQEQNQLFLWSADYFCLRASVPGGVADWLGELLVQFCYVPWLGALLLALLVVLFAYAVGFVPAALLLWLLGDPNVLVGYAFAVLLAAEAHLLNRSRGRLGLLSDVLAVPLVYWLCGPLAWLYVVLRLRRQGWRTLFAALWLLVVQLAVFRYVATQSSPDVALLPHLFYRTPLQLPALMWIIPIVVVPSVWLPRLFLPSLPVSAVLVWVGLALGYDADVCELLRQDYLIRHERWDDIVARAARRTVATPFWSNSVNLALAMKGQLAYRQFDFYQSGPDALLMPMVRDNVSNLPTAEAFWRLGMVNEAQRYASDLQASILNARKSGRLEQRLAECMVVNGQYAAARKHLALLKQSLYYRSWATEAERCMQSEEAVDAHPVWGRQRQLRFREHLLFSNAEKGKMLGILFQGNPSNRLALQYFMGQLLLDADAPLFMQALPLARQYGGYGEMPLVYQDAVRCMQSRTLPDSPYARYVKRTKGGATP